MRKIASASAAITAFICSGLYFDWNKSEWAAWVQAIGSIAALGVAIFVMSRQNAHSAKLVVQADALAVLRRAETVLIMAESAHWQITNCLNDVDRNIEQRNAVELNASLASTKIVMSEVKPRLVSIPIHDLGSAQLAEGVIRLTEVAGTAHSFCDLWVGPANAFETARLIARLREKADQGITAYRQGLIQLRAAVR